MKKGAIVIMCASLFGVFGALAKDKGVDSEFEFRGKKYVQTISDKGGTCRTPRGFRLKPETTRGSARENGGCCAREGFWTA